MPTGRVLGVALTLLITACTGVPARQPMMESTAADAAATVTRVADRYYAETLQRSPEDAYFAGVELERHDGMHDNSLAAQTTADESIDEMFATLDSVDGETLVGTPEWITLVYLLQTLGAEIATRSCRSELWDVNQMGGWHSGYAQIANLQPVGSTELREQSLARWSKFPAFIEVEAANLAEGLRQGYSAPRVVVQRVIEQLDGLLALPIEQSPFYSPAVRDPEPAFAAATRELVSEQIYPALRTYRDYLQQNYLAAAREELSITANPNGAACYRASLQSYTTLERSGKQVYQLGQQVVAANRQVVEALGEEHYESHDFATILARTEADPADQFTTAEELLAFAKAAVARAGAATPNWVGRMPQQPVEVVPFEAFEEGTGRSAHYNPASADRPGEYRIPLHQPEEQSRGNVESTAFHETWPGHHLQVAFSQSMTGLHPVTGIIWFSGPGEGWARYAEGLAEEMGLYETASGPILRRAWPARGMVVDPGIHLFGWTRQQAKDFMRESGRFPEARLDEMVDRIAILPGQLTAYDSGGLEILALRRQAEAALGAQFDIREFHDRVLENGTIPLAALRQHIERWIASKQDTPPPSPAVQ